MEAHPPLWNAVIGDARGVHGQARQRMSLAGILRLNPREQGFSCLVRHAQLAVWHQRKPRALALRERSDCVLEAFKRRCANDCVMRASVSTKASDNST